MFEIQESSKDRPFASGFKQGFNAVLKYGMAVLFIALTIFLIIGLLAFVYGEYGVFGVILAIVILVLLFVLLALLVDGLLEFILPGY